MKRYTILKPILMELMDDRNGIEGFEEDLGKVAPGQGFELESNETDTFWLVKGDQKWASLYRLCVLEHMLKDGDIAEKQGA